MATFLMNEKREFILNIEKRHNVHVLVIANPYFQSPQYNITRLKEDNVSKNKKPSYSFIQQPEVHTPRLAEEREKSDEPVVKPYSGQSSTKQKEIGFFQRLWTILFARAALEAEAPAKEKQSQEKKYHPHHSKRYSHSNRKRRGRKTFTNYLPTY